MGGVESYINSMNKYLKKIRNAAENIRKSANMLVNASIELGVPKDGGAIIKLYGDMVKHIYMIISAAEKIISDVQSEIDQITRCIREYQMQIEWRERELGESGGC